MTLRVVMIPASTEVEDARRLVDAMEATHVIVWEPDAGAGPDAEREGEGEGEIVVGYLYPADVVRSLATPNRRLGESLGVRGRSADIRLPRTQWGTTPELVGFLGARLAVRRGVVVLGTGPGGPAGTPVTGGGAPSPDQTSAAAPDGVTPDDWTALSPAGAFAPPTAVDGQHPAGAAPASAYAVVVDHPTSVPLGEALVLGLSIGADVDETEAIPFAARVGDVVDVVVIPRTGFVLDGDAEVRLTVGAHPTQKQQVLLRADREGIGEVICYAFRDGDPLGSVTIRPEVTPAGTAAGEPQSRSGHVPGDSGSSARAELELLVLEESGPDGRRLLRYYLRATDPDLGLNFKRFGPVTIEGGPAAYFASLYRDIDEIPVGTANLRRLAAERLAAIGSHLFSELFPPDLQALLWGLRSRITSVLVQSVEPWIPWELCRLHGMEDGRIVEGEFLCEAFEVTRWLPELRRHPALTARSIGVIQPPSDLTSAPQETAMLQGLAAPDRTVSLIPPTYTDVRAALTQATYDAVHFVGHGRFPDPEDGGRAELSLTGSQVLRPIDISGATRNLGQRTPIVFLNACQSGQRAVELTGNGGWALAMLEAGAGAFIGSHWDVTDTLALEFATEFYARVLAGDTFPAAARRARLAIRDDGDPTWLAYAVYADPQARVVAAGV